MIEYYQYDRAHRVSRHSDLLREAQKARLIREAEAYAAAERIRASKSSSAKPRRFSLAFVRQVVARYARLATT
jgi:hypothetical protein